MSISIAQSRQQLSALICAAQVTPQVITKRNKAVAVLVSAADYFTRTKAAAAKPEDTFFNQLMQLRSVNAPPDDDGIPGVDTSRLQAWSRANAFVSAD